MSVFRKHKTAANPYRIVAMILLLLPLSVAAQNTIDQVLAIVDSDVITLNEYRSRHRQARLEDSSVAPYAGKVDRNILESMVDERIQVGRAKSRGIRVSESEIDGAIAFIARQNDLTVEQLVRQLERDNFTFEEFRQSIGNQQLIRKLADAVANSRVVISDEEIDRYVKAHGELLENADESYEVAHLFIVTDGKSTAEVEAEVENLRFIRDSIEKGLAFEQAVRNYADAGKDEGGYLGWRAVDQLPELFVDALREMDPVNNNLSGILQSDNGLHLIKMLNRRGSGKLVLQQRIQHILIQPDQNNTPEEALKLAKEIQQQLIEGESFEKLARLHSQDLQSGPDGGDLGWVNPGQLVERFEEAARRLPLNTISEPVQTRYGFHILRVLERREADLAGEVAANRAREAIFKRKAGELFDNWFRGIRERTYIEYTNAVSAG